MPITLTSAAGANSILASLVDGNFEALQEFLKERIAGVDISGTFDRSSLDINSLIYHKSFNFNTFRVQSRDNLFLEGIFESNFRREGDSPYCDTSPMPDIDTYKTVVLDGSRNAEMMELLGKPGKSFYYDWQEDGYTDPVAAYGAAGWPPSFGDHSRWPDDRCYSYWITVPGAAGRLYVPYPSVVRLDGVFKGCLSFSPVAYHMGLHTAGYGDVRAKRFLSGSVRVGLFVDTNPILYTDEFTNINPNIQGSYCTWKKIGEITVPLHYRGYIHIPGAVALKGGRAYNFALKFRRANTIGYRNADTNTFHTGDWEFSSGYANAPIWTGAQPPNHACNGISQHTILWESTCLHCTVFPGRDDAFVYNFTDIEFSETV